MAGLVSWLLFLGCIVALLHTPDERERHPPLRLVKSDAEHDDRA